MNGLYAIPVAAAFAVIVVLTMSYGASFEAIITADSNDPSMHVNMDNSSSTDIEPVDTSDLHTTDIEPVDTSDLHTTDIEPVDTDSEPIDVVNADDLNRLIVTTNQFAMDFYSQASSTSPEKNIFFSPWSIFTAFAIAFEGADGKAYDELQKVFGFIMNDTQRRVSYKFINNDLNQKNTEYELSIANALWLQQGVSISPQYVDIANTYYDSTVDLVDLESKSGIDRINKWADENTNGNITKILTSPISDPLLAITNAIYFKGVWVTPFDKDRTRDMEFWIDSSNSTQTQMMQLGTSYFNYARTDNLQILELPYNGNKISMFIFLHDDKNGISLLENLLTMDALETWKNQLRFTKMSVTIPKFTLNIDYDLVSSLKLLGLVQPFLKDYNFPKIHDHNHTWITKATHKAFVDVNEEGTEAAAVTAVKIKKDSVPLEFNANHPFIFIIQDIHTGHILFMGKMMDPT